MRGEVDLRSSLMERQHRRFKPNFQKGAGQYRQHEQPQLQEHHMPELDCTLSQDLPLVKESQGIVFIKLDFTMLYTHPQTKVPPIRSIRVILQDEVTKSSYTIEISLGREDSRPEYNESRLFRVIKVRGESPIRQVLKRVESEPSQASSEDSCQIEIEYLKDIFPRDDKEAKEFLQRKLWLEINARTNKLILGKGDLQKVKNIELWSNNLYEKEVPRGWDRDVDVFPMPIGQQIKERDFTQIRHVRFELTFWRDKMEAIMKQPQRQPARSLEHKGSERQPKRSKTPEKEFIDHEEYSRRWEKEKMRIMDFINFNLLDIKRFEGPVVSRNPSLLNRAVAPLSNMSPQIQFLYEMLERLCLYKLPEFELNETNHREYVQYNTWGNAKFSIHSSLTTPFGYFKEHPIGILNHMLKIKTGKPWQPINLKKNEKEDKTAEEIKQEIYKTRSGYLRFEVVPTEGLSPGSPAVFQIWPPHYCSSIHNHGQAEGLIKVLGGAIRVENFKDLSYLEVNPYMSNQYRECEYTWLTPYSFGIHRLVNIHSQTCLTLQAYANVEGSHEYFSVLSRVNNQPKLKRYYPQHDWLNYLNYHSHPECSEYDKQYILAVIDKYNLRTPQTKQIDAGFMRFMLAMKKEFQLLANNFD